MPDVLELPTPREATCLSCGCTDSMACEGGCGWLAVDYALGAGVCTSCGTPEEAETALESFRAAPPEEQLHRLTRPLWDSFLHALFAYLTEHQRRTRIGLAKFGLVATAPLNLGRHLVARLDLEVRDGEGPTPEEYVKAELLEHATPGDLEGLHVAGDQSDAVRAELQRRVDQVARAGEDPEITAARDRARRLDEERG